MTAVDRVSVARAILGVLEVDRGRPWRCADLARHLGVTTHAAATRCYALERRGLIVRVSRGSYRAAGVPRHASVDDATPPPLLEPVPDAVA